jgi:hypothetical protein
MAKKTLEIKLRADTSRVLNTHIEIIGANIDQWIATAIYEKLKKEGIYTHDPVKPWGLSK